MAAFTVVILAGGQSSRMLQDKAELTLVAPGQLPASLKPSKKRNIENDVTVVAIPCKIVAIDQTPIVKVKPIRAPNLSNKPPKTPWPIAYEIMNTDIMLA